MSTILYYLIIYPLSMLPFGVLYFISDVLFLFVFYILPYRKKIVINNISNSFPDKSEEEIKIIAKKFYQHFCDIILETIKTFNLSEKKAREIMNIKNLSIPNKFYEKGQDVLIVGGHYGNWEAYTYSANEHKHTLCALFTPLSNKFLNGKMKTSREKFGMKLYPTNKYKSFMSAKHDNPVGYIYSIDQSPRKGSGYWMKFLNQDTAIQFGAEKVSTQYNLPVIFGATRKLGRGRFEIEYTTVVEDPSTCAYGEITTKITNKMEDLILEAPEYWLWTHKRWKHKKEQDDQ